MGWDSPHTSFLQGLQSYHFIWAPGHSEKDDNNEKVTNGNVEAEIQVSEETQNIYMNLALPIFKITSVSSSSCVGPIK